MSEEKEKILLHVCCAVCSPYVIKVLSQKYVPTIYFYNPNIHPFEEYLKRRLEVEAYVRSLGLDFIDGEYDIHKWYDITSGLDKEPEGGVRCEICFKIRMNRVVLYAINNGFSIFATTLTVSPHKNSRVINHVCKELAQDYGIRFYKADFKKNDGFKISSRMAKELDFYYQDYCGCFPSLEQSRERRRTREETLRQSQQIASPTNLSL